MSITLSNLAMSGVSASTTAEAPFVPTTLVQENWAGSGPVGGKTPSPISGGGTWQVSTSGYPVNYGSGSASPDTAGEVGAGTFRHSVTLTDATISTTVEIGSYGGIYANVNAYARTTPGPTGEITDGYYVTFSNGVNLFKIVSGVSTQIASSFVNPSSLPTSFTVSGSTLTVKINNVQVIQITDTSITTAGYWGYSVSNSTSGEEFFNSIVGPVTIQTA